VTGGSSGIGKETARALARRGATVVIVSRPARALEDAVADLRASAGSTDVHALGADLSLVSEVRRIAGEIDARFDRVDLLVNNAGTVPVTRDVTREGHEMAFATNCLATFTLTTLLLPKLRTSKPARVVSLFGDGTAKIDLDDLESVRTPFDGWSAYVRSKTGVLLLTQELARRVSPAEVTFNAALPGVVNTAQMANMRGIMKLLVLVMRPFLATPAQGARTPLWLATAPEVAGLSGKAFGRAFGDGRKEFSLKPHVRDPGTCKRFYEACARMVAAVPS
jgi:NAD(P)-dependent dehydrogenase (short-subunit alcohol dehydrogenase family)